MMVTAKIFCVQGGEGVMYVGMQTVEAAEQME